MAEEPQSSQRRGEKNALFTRLEENSRRSEACRLSDLGFDLGSDLGSDHRCGMRNRGGSVCLYTGRLTQPCPPKPGLFPGPGTPQGLPGKFCFKVRAGREAEGVWGEAAGSKPLLGPSPSPWGHLCLARPSPGSDCPGLPSTFLPRSQPPPNSDPPRGNRDRPPRSGRGRTGHLRTRLRTVPRGPGCWDLALAVLALAELNPGGPHVPLFGTPVARRGSAFPGVAHQGSGPASGPRQVLVPVHWAAVWRGPNHDPW